MKLPNFVHNFPGWWTHNYECEEAHSVQSGLHVEIDFILNYLQARPRHKIRKSKSLSMFLRGFISFMWGLNCGFPPKDVIKYVIWEVRGFPLSSEFKEDSEK